MNLHEYQAKELFARYGLPVLPGQVAATPEEAGDIAAALGGTVVIKAQVLAGGRGKAGGVKLAHSPEEAAEKARDILALTIKGLPVRKVLVTPGRRHRARAVPRRSCSTAAASSPLFMVSAEGGVDIEEVARTAPEKIIKWPIPLDGLAALPGARPVQAAAPGRQAGPAGGGHPDEAVAGLVARATASWPRSTRSSSRPRARSWRSTPRSSLDDNADLRHRDWEHWRDPADETPGQRLAREKGLTYVKLDGDVGCVVNGAGLAMATMDLVKHYGGEPANFLDIGGSSNPEKVDGGAAHHHRRPVTREGDPLQHLRRHHPLRRRGQRHRALARGVAAGVPLVIRLTGTNEEAARKILADHGLSATTSMDEGVRKVIARAQEVTA